eukprot:GHVS01009006.1.p1 GENE.GHVS01009006.1~~GHVS01009006.1.p1  ORF type:complete len:391 (+),score=68.62 GHVS01009006.1:2-1174(+)
MNSPPPSPPSSSSLFRSRLHEQYVLKQDTDLVLYLSSQHLRMGGLYWGITTLDLLGYDHTLKDQIMWGGGQNDRCGSTEAGRISKAPVCSIAGSPVSTGPATSAGSPVSTCSADITATTTESATPCIIAATSAGIYVSTGHATSAGSSVSTVSATSAGIPVSTVSATSAGSSVSTCSVDITATESSASSQAGLHVVCRGRDEVINWIGACQNEDGGFGPSLHHDSHIASTHYAVLVLSLYGALHSINTPAAATYIQSLQDRERGGFCGDLWGEADTRFVYCGLSCLTILGQLNLVDVELSAAFLLSCMNFDGGFASIPGAESHAAYTFCCVAGLALCRKLHCFDKELLAWWLCERQTPNMCSFWISGACTWERLHARWKRRCVCMYRWRF